MPSFEKKHLTRPTRVCFRLKEAREIKNFSIEEMARRTHIDQKYIEAIEACDFDSIPFGIVYQKNFLKRYATVLNIPSQTFLDQFLDEEITSETATTIQPNMTKKKRLSNLPMILRSLLFVSMILLLAGYLGFEVKKSIDPPSLTVYSPPDGFITSAQSLTVRGETEHETELSINGETIVPGNDGGFAEQMYLSPGINTIVVAAKSKHGKTTLSTRHVVLKDAKTVSVNK